MLKTLQTHESKSLSTGGTVTLSIPVGGKIHGVMLRFATSGDADVTEAAIRAEIGLIRLTINGKDIVNAPVTKILDLYEMAGVNVTDPTAVASVVELNVGRLLFTDPDARELFGLGTADVQSVQVSVTAGTLSTIANVQAFTSRSAVNENLGIYAKYINYPISFNSTGDHTVDTLPRDPDNSYLAVLADAGASGTMTKGELRVNNISVKDKVYSAINKLMNSSNRVATPSGYFVYGMLDGSLKTRLPMVNVSDLRFIQTFSVAPGAGGYNMSALTLVNLPTNF